MLSEIDIRDWIRLEQVLEQKPTSSSFSSPDYLDRDIGEPVQQPCCVGEIPTVTVPMVKIK
jgi:hypothetical protein